MHFSTTCSKPKIYTSVGMNPHCIFQKFLVTSPILLTRSLPSSFSGQLNLPCSICTFSCTYVPSHVKQIAQPHPMLTYTMYSCNQTIFQHTDIIYDFLFIISFLLRKKHVEFILILFFIIAIIIQISKNVLPAFPHFSFITHYFIFLLLIPFSQLEAPFHLFPKQLFISIRIAML